MSKVDKNILSTSIFIKNLYEDDDPDNIDYVEESDKIFEQFSLNRNLKIDIITAKNYIKKFNLLYNTSFFKDFQPPHVQEYFCQQLNFLLLIDFILSFFRVDNKNFDVKTINTLFIFDFFVKLGEFYTFMDYLAVDEVFIGYLKYMLTLYTLQLDRDVIEQNYDGFIEILDNFFVYAVIPKVFSSIGYKNISSFEDNVNKMLKKYPKELENCNEYASDLTGANYDFLDRFFNLSTYNYEISVKKSRVEVPNPKPPPLFINENNNNNNDNDDFNSDYDSDDDSVDDYNSDDEYDHNGNRKWTPTIKIDMPNIETTDINYEKHRKEFIIRQFQNYNKNYKNILKEIKELSETIRIKDYSNFMPNSTDESILRVKTILGSSISLSGLSDNNIYNIIYPLACEYGHLNIVKDVLNHDTNKPSSFVRNAAESPNREILKYLMENKHKYPNLKNELEKYKDATFYEPKLRFNF